MVPAIRFSDVSQNENNKILQKFKAVWVSSETTLQKYSDSLCSEENTLLQELKWQMGLVASPEDHDQGMKPASTLGVCILSHSHKCSSQD